MRTDLRRRQWALFLCFLVPGLAISTWVTRTPDIRDALEASTAQMGLVLFGLSLGSIAGILTSGALTSRHGTRPVFAVGTAATALSLLVIGAGSASGAALLVAAGLFLFGWGMGTAEVSGNVDAADIEQVSGKVVLPALHGFFSLGTFAGAVTGFLFTAAGVPVHVHLVAVAVLAAVVLAANIGALHPGVGQRTAGADGEDADEAVRRRRAERAVWKDPRLLLIGLVVLAMGLAEGAATDWLPLLMVDGHGMDAALGSMVYACFAASMMIGRFSGGPFIRRFGRPKVVAASALAGAAGISAVVFVDHAALAAAGVLLWGLGTALAFPVAVSAAGNSGPESSARVSTVARMGYLALLAGPPILGFLGEAHGLRGAMVVVLAVVALSVFLAPATGTPRRARAEEAAGQV